MKHHEVRKIRHLIKPGCRSLAVIRYLASGLFIFIFSFQIKAAGKIIREVMDEASLGGFVVDEQSDLPLQYVQVILYNNIDSTVFTGTISGENGSFKIEKISPGNYFVVFNLTGYEKKKIPDIEIGKKQQPVKLGKISLRLSPEMLKTLQVTEHQHGLIFSADRQVINASEAINSGDGTATGLLQTSPSVTVDNNNQVYLRGNANFILLIDGKRATIPPSDILKQIPATSVDKIEIITNPSAKYDSEGTSGIINVLLKKNKSNKSAALLNLRISTYNKYNLDGTASTGNSKTKVYFNAGLFSNESSMDNISERKGFDGENEWSLNSEGNIKRIHNGCFARGSVDYSPTAVTKYSIESNLSWFGFSRLFNSFFAEIPSPPTGTNYTISNDNFIIKGLSKDIVLSYKRDLDTTEHYFQFMFSGSRWDGINDDITNRHFSNADRQKLGQITERDYREENMIGEFFVNADYVNQLKKIKLESGLQLHHRPSTCTYTTTLFTDSVQQQTPDPLYTGSHRFNQDKLSGYGILTGSSKDATLQVGVRGEYYSRQFLQAGNSNKYNYSDLLLFPSMHLSIGKPSKYQVQLSYSKRVTYPNDWTLSPTPFLSDGYTIQIGNPELKPEIAHNIEINQLKYFRQHLLSVLLYYQLYTNKISRSVSLQEPSVYLMSFDNYPKASLYGIEGSINLSVSGMVKINGSLTWFHQTHSGITDKTITWHKNSFNTRLLTTILLNRSTRCQLSFVYNGAVREGQSVREPFYGFNAGIRHGFLNNKLSASLEFNDIFNTMEFRYSLDETGLVSDIVWKQEYPVISLTLSYSINDFKQRRNESHHESPIQPGI